MHVAQQILDFATSRTMRIVNKPGRHFEQSRPIPELKVDSEFFEGKLEYAAAYNPVWMSLTSNSIGGGSLALQQKMSA